MEVRVVGEKARTTTKTKTKTTIKVTNTYVTKVKDVTKTQKVQIIDSSSGASNLCNNFSIATLTALIGAMVLVFLF